MKKYENPVYNVKKLPSGEIVDKNIKVTIDGLVSFVPMSEFNTDYVEILRQVKEEGLTIKEAEE